MNNCSLPLYSTMNQAYTLGDLATLSQRRKQIISPKAFVAPVKSFTFFVGFDYPEHGIYLAALEAMRFAKYEPKDETATLHAKVKYPYAKYGLRDARAKVPSLREKLQAALGEDVQLTIEWDSDKWVEAGVLVEVREVV